MRGAKRECDARERRRMLRWYEQEFVVVEHDLQDAFATTSAPKRTNERERERADPSLESRFSRKLKRKPKRLRRTSCANKENKYNQNPSFLPSHSFHSKTPHSETHEPATIESYPTLSYPSPRSSYQ